jgi:hypothetical protein
MNAETIRRWFSFAISTAALSLGACAETPNVDRRLAYVSQHGELSAERRDAIAAGRVEPGMTMDEVRATVGEPIHLTRSDRRGPEGPIEVQVWIYPGPVVLPSVMRSAANSEFLVRLRFENGVLREIHEI